MRRALATHRRDFIAILVLVAGAIGVAAYVLYHQPSFTFGQSYYTVRAEFATSAAVTPGQGQAVTIAGVQVGLVGGVTLENGRAVVTMNIFKQYAPIYRNATVLLRPRTPLKDMYLALDPGTRQSGAVPVGGMLGAGSTSPDIDLDQILASLDSDTRSYLLLLLAGGAQAFNHRHRRFRPCAPRSSGSSRSTAIRERSRRCCRCGAATSASRSTTFSGSRRRSAASTGSSRR